MSEKCSSCEAPIQWRDMLTKGGKIKKHPFDAATKPGWIELAGGMLSSHPVFTSHFATCPNAAQHRVRPPELALEREP